MSINEHQHRFAAGVRWRVRLSCLKREAISRGRLKEEIEAGRCTLRERGATPREIATVEFAEMRMFDDLASGEPAVQQAAAAGGPSDETIALVKRGGYCTDCFCRLYREFAESFRELHKAS